ncbi:hypothetical protein O181_087081 [Austropuccinia psidii MF-1]|uniref:Integrase catalytic domain-containing protein n=1 Tax=Austropuccinia psidii MF-1 TaxID=1389203 RepID=A0A9Q3IP12_9BASI|nr:hypothetical protein [Austropuccinia psidii MF-1]
MTEGRIKAYVELKGYHTNAPFLFITQCKFPFKLYSYSCGKGLGAVIRQSQIINDVISHRGLSQAIISDGDSKLTSASWTNIHNPFGAKSSFQTAYNPQTEGLEEIMLQTLEDMI